MRTRTVLAAAPAGLAAAPAGLAAALPAVAGALLLAPGLALACPYCARDNGWWGQLILAAMVIFPLAVGGLLIQVVRRGGDREDR